MKKFLETYSNLYNPLVIGCTDKKELPQLLTDLNKHLNYFGLQDKTLISVGLPNTSAEIYQLKKLQVQPNKVILVQSTKPQSCNSNLLSAMKLHYPNKTQQFTNENMEELCKKVKMALELSEPVVKTKYRWLPRVCIVGQRGAGARLQGKLLAKHFDLVFGKCK